MSPRLLGATLAVAASLGLGACSSYGHDNYGYSGVSVGVGYNSPYYGWYDDYYYPGTGYYVYDRRGARHRWARHHQNYWLARRVSGRRYADNWSGYERYQDRRADYRRERRDDRREYRRDRREDARDYRRDRREDARDARRDRRGERRGERRDRRDRRDRRRGPGETA
ncbi:MAG: hypothetical protein JY451_11595 [Erythrobacter sp.]|nr:MAG: hypothetical protein JY451_11595 [Erythrobacter sp.]